MTENNRIGYADELRRASTTTPRYYRLLQEVAGKIDRIELHAEAMRSAWAFLPTHETTKEEELILSLAAGFDPSAPQQPASDRKSE